MTRLTVLTRVFSASLLVSAILVAGSSSAAVPNADDDLSYVNPRYADAATLAIEGTLQAVADTVPGSEEYAYSVRTDEGDAIALPASFGDQAEPGGRFEGEVVLQGEVAEDIRDEGVIVTPGKVIDGDTAAGQTAIEVLADQEAPVPVASATVSDPVAEAATPSAHRAYVAVITNLSGGVPSTSSIPGILDYWDDEAGDSISSFTVAGTVEYSSNADDDPNSAVDRATCGFSNNGWNAVWTEASAKFPTINFGSGSGNHLIVLVPSSCGASGTVGIGTVGNSIADGGASIVAVTSGVSQIAAHELGHNFSLGHANAEHCSPCTVEPYFNAYSVMGFAIYAKSPPVLDTATRQALDLTDNVDVISGAGQSTIDLQPRSADAGRRGLKVVDPVNGAVYFVDYRSGTGRDAGAFYAGGGTLNWFTYSPGIVITVQTAGKQTKVLTRYVSSTYLTSLAPSAVFVNSSNSVRITAGPQSGEGGAQVTVSLATTPMASAIPTVAPSVTRVARTMTAVTNGWDPETAFTYQWRINGVVVAGATGATYRPPTSSYKKSLSVSVTGSKPGFLTTTRTSAARTIEAGLLIPVVPRMSGIHKVGRTLKVVTGTWAYGPKLTYRWYANGKAISNATKSYYKITSGKRGKYITVRVTGSKYGFNSASRTSARVTKVR